MNSTTQAPTFSLVLPTYNERQNLPGAVTRIAGTLDALGQSFEIIVVDDDSPDETWRLAEELAAHDSRIRVLRRRDERGLATAVAAGWRLARGRVLGVMDADLQYPPETLPRLLAALDRYQADVAICSRYAPGATVQHWSTVRWFISWAARLFGRLLLPTALRGIADPGAGYFLLRRQVIDGVDLRPRGFKILIEVLARGQHERVIEVGLPYEGRKEGQSKFRSRQVVEYLAHLATLAGETGEGVKSARQAGIELGAVALVLGSLWALTTLGGLHYLVAAVAAAELTLLGTFALADGTRARRDEPGPGRLGRLRRWHAVRIPGTAVALLALGALTEGAGLSYLTSGLLALALASIVNHAVATHRRQPDPARPVAITS
jgi:dolichol-phosphate mannosyltransferase